jgi:DmsE family decaheme c-type cytochrome
MKWIWVLLGLSALGGAVRAAEPTAPAVTYTRGGADTCLGCHDDPAMLAIFRGPHGAPTDPRSPFGHGQLQCEACHGPGGNHTRRPPSGQKRVPVIHFGAAADTPPSEQNAKCLGCHEADAGAGWHAGAHASHDVACAACHRSHAARDPVLMNTSQPEVCGNCHHVEKLEQYRAFAHPMAAGKMSCTSCHSPHQARGDAELLRQTTNDTCYSCHADKRGPFIWEHAPVAEDCTSCHAPHGSNHPGMLVQRGPMLCQSCHSQAGHPSVALTPAAGLPGGSQMPYVLGMNCMNCHSQVHGSNHPSGSKLMR